MAALEVLALDEATPQIRAPGASDTYTMPRPLALSAGTLTTDVRVLDLSATWNAANIYRLKFNVTNTASANTSKLVDIQLGGVSYFSLMSAPGLSAAYARITAGGQTLVGLGSLNSDVPQVCVQNSGAFGWSINSDAFSGTYDLWLYLMPPQPRPP
jgi:hypothetical protein